jgi:hypothetical protein
MEKLLLTVREAADVLTVSRSRVYELIYAEQLDSVRMVLASNGGGELYVDMLKNKRARTVPLCRWWCLSWIGGAPDEPG